MRMTRARGGVGAFFSKINVDYILAALGFFVGRVTVFGSFNPVGVAYLSQFFLRGRHNRGGGKVFYIAAAFTALGVLTRYNRYYSAKYIACAVILSGLQFLFLSRAERADGGAVGGSARAGLVALSLMAAGLIFAVINKSAYLGVVALVEAAFAFAFGFIFSFFSESLEKKELGAEGLISLAVMVGAITVGAADIYLGALSLRYFSCFLIVTLLSSGGAAAGCAGGVLIGVIINMAGFEPLSFAVILGIGGLAAGALSGQYRGVLDKIISVAAAYSAFAAFSLYSGYNFFTRDIIFSASCAALAFIFAQDGILLKLPILAKQGDIGLNDPETAAGIAREKLEKYSDALAKLSRSYDAAAESRKSLSRDTAAKIIDDAASRVCVDCRKCEVCWKEGGATKAAIELTAICERDGKATPTAALAVFCPMAKKFAETLSRSYEIYREAAAWRGKLSEAKRLTAEQTRGIAESVRAMAYEIGEELNFLEKPAKRLADEFLKSGVSAQSAVVYEAGGLLKAKVRLSGETAARTLVSAANKAFGAKTRITEEYGYRGETFALIEERPTFGLRYYCAESSREGTVCGDSFSVTEKDARAVMAISDGMGFGERANRESVRAINLLEELTDAGIAPSLSARLINSALLLKNREETFTTIDICAIDLITGEAEFIKSGAAPAFVISGGEIKAVRSSSLPAGLLIESLESDSAKIALSGGDIIIMATDGVIDSDIFAPDKEEWLIRALKAVKDSDDPKEIAERLIKKASDNYGIQAKDDMTVVAARITEI